MTKSEETSDDMPLDWMSILANTPLADWKPSTDGAPKKDGSREGGSRSSGEESYFSKAKDWASAHPIQAAALGTNALIIAAPALIASPALAVAGFGANGVAGGSIAAGVQSGIGSVSAGGLFATLQSAGAGGYGVAAVNGAIRGGAAGMGCLGAQIYEKTRKADPKKAEDEGADGGSGSDGSSGE
ncbi:hypothetical protein QQZ08_004921 [Neonectria magnoliae]|uniref:Uncharacterized protein n=1 Tax=Neonectria magnoliae TaxID=2732573 RepID=A0ABR1I4L5_9HYPO